MHNRVLTQAEFSARTNAWLNITTGLDFETNGKELWEPGARIVGVSMAGWRDGDYDGFYIPLAHKRGANADPSLLQAVIEFLKTGAVVPYYTPMEAAWAWKKWGIRLMVRGDAYIAGRILHLKEGGLKDCVEKYLKKQVTRIEECLPPGCYDFSEADSDSEQVITYCVDDAINSMALEFEFERRIREHNLDAVYAAELQACAVMAMESADGYEFNTDAFAVEVSREKARVAHLEQEVFAALGGERFLISSNPQLTKRLNALGILSPIETATPGGQSWSKAALELVRGKHPAIPKIIEWKTSFAVANMLSGKVGAAVDGDGRVHPRWNPMSLSGGGRFACEKPPLPTLPKQMRRAFKAPAGKRWMMLQWQQPELRMLALLARCHAFAEFLTTAPDPFAHWAALWGTSRDTAKTLVYTYISSVADLEIVARYVPNGVLVAALNGWFEAYPEIKQYMRETARVGAERYHVRGWMNRRFKCEEETPTARGAEAVRAVIQGSVATALKMVICKLANLRDMFEESGTQTGYLFKGFGQLIPCYDTLYYVIDRDVPLGPHLALFHREFQINLFQGDQGEFYLPAAVGVGEQWGDIREVKDPQTVQEFADSLV